MRRISHWTYLALAAAAAILLGALVGCGGGDSTASQPDGESAAGSPAAKGANDGQSAQSEPSADGDLKTVLVFDRKPAPSPSESLYHARLEKGELPDQAVEATILTDTECTPDRDGISHCKNHVRLADGGRVVIRTSHDMSEVPCLAPEDQVMLGWA